MQADLSSDDDEDASGRGGSCGSNKRVMANRQSAQRSRMRKLQFISDLEANVQSLENDIKSMNPMHSALRQKHAGAPLATHNLKVSPCQPPCMPPEATFAQRGQLQSLHGLGSKYGVLIWSKLWHDWVFGSLKLPQHHHG